MPIEYEFSTTINPFSIKDATPAAGDIIIDDEGVLQGTAGEMDFIGSGVDVSVVAGIATVDIPATPSVVIKKTRLEAVGHVVAGSPLSVVASGVGYIKSGDNGFLEISSILFISNNNIQICPGGAEEVKGVDVVWVNSNTFTLSTDLDPGDYILIYS